MDRSDFHVVVTGCNQGEAQQVMQNRLTPDADYGFSYDISYAEITGRKFTRDQVSQALNRAVNLIEEDIFDGESSETIRNASFMDLTVNAALWLLDKPGASLDEIIRGCWEGETQECDGRLYTPLAGFQPGVAVAEQTGPPRAECGRTDAAHEPHVYAEDAAAMVRSWLT